MYSRYSKSEWIFIAECSMKRSGKVNTKISNHYLKNHNIQFYPVKSVCFIYVKVREVKSCHLNINAYLLIM